MQEATFCDWLINRGVEFHPDTVIVDAEKVTYMMRTMQNEADIENKIHSILQDNTLPPFANMFIEYLYEDYVTGVIFNKKLVPNTDVSTFDVRVIVVGTQKDSPSWMPDDYIEIVWSNGVYDRNFSTLNAEQFPSLFVAFWSFYLFHKKVEFELVDYSRQKRRRIERKTGKAPSPYFRIIDASDRPQKRYAGSGVSIGRKLDKAHIVRGHFRHTQDHPIAQFNGTFWIPSHMKGKGENAPPPRYKIILRGE